MKTASIVIIVALLTLVVAYLAQDRNDHNKAEQHEKDFKMRHGK